MSDEPIDELLARAYAVDGPDDNRELYADWAATYDETFLVASRYVYHRHVASLFAFGFGGGGPVLDVGCGTGAVGVALRELGVETVDGIDISAEMLAVAAAKRFDDEPVYRELIEADLTGAIDVATGRYAGIVSAGAFTHGHLGPEALDELFRVASSGARCAIGINAAHFVDLGFERALDAHRDAATISYEMVEAPIYDGADTADPDNLALIALITVA